MRLLPIVRRPLARRVGLTLAALVFTAGPLACAAQEARPPQDEWQALRRPRTEWNQAEREKAFANWEKVFAVRNIPRGKAVHALPEGPALAGFESGGPGARELQRNIDDFKLAGIVVVHDGRIRLERYALGHSASGRWVSFSMAKSLTSTLVGAAIRDGYIRSVDDPVTRYIPELRDSAYDGVSVRQLLMMASGAKWNEDYRDPAADVSRFYSAPIDASGDATVSYMRTLARAEAPGTTWHYNTGETNLIGVVVARATGKDLATYASEKIWAPYGMEENASWMLDRTRKEHGGCCIVARTRDYARLGQFILDGARIEGRPVVADGWLEAATRKQIDIGQPGAGYGYQWWTRDNGTFSALGIHGQQIYIDPARHLVIAVNSAWLDATSNEATAARVALFDAIRAAIDGRK